MTSWQPDPDSGAAGQRSAPPPSAHPFATPQPAPGQHAAAPVGPMGYPQRPMTRPPARPAAVTAAVWLTWVFSALVAMFFLVAVLVILVDRDQLLAKLQESPSFADRGYTSREILGFLWVVSATSIFWSLCAMALAALVLRRVEIGRRVLLVSAALAGIFCLLAVPVGWVHAVVAFTCVGLLHRRSTRDWFAGRDVQPPAGPPGPWAGPPGGSSGGALELAAPAAAPGRASPAGQATGLVTVRIVRDGIAARSGSGQQKRHGLSVRVRQACRSARCSRRTPSSTVAVSLQNAQRTLCRPSSWSS